MLRPVGIKNKSHLNLFTFIPWYNFDNTYMRFLELYQVVMRMQKHWKILSIALLFVTVFSALPTDVQATYIAEPGLWDDDDSLGVFIEYADYLDYDYDGYKDDIITIFSIHPATDDDFDEWGGKMEVDCILVLPSRKSFTFSFETKLRDGIRVTIVWLNCALEEGWYVFGVEATPLGRDAPDSGGDKCIFDPPEGGLPAPPIINIADIEEL